MELFGFILNVTNSLCIFDWKYFSNSVYTRIGIMCIIVSLVLDLTLAYNLDLETATIHAGETRSMFGFTVALHQDQGSKWLLVGAPKAQTSQPGITRGGAVFRCPIESGSECQQIPFDIKGNNIRHNGSKYVDVEEKSYQWFGASLYSSQNGIIVACAPRYVYFSNRLDKREPVGTCYLSRPSSTNYDEYSPCKSREQWGYNREGSCQAGYSVAFSDEGRQLVIGAVGSWYWQGQIFSFNFEDEPGRYRATPEGRSKDDYSYMGYSTAVGNFDDDKREDYVVGVPRGRQLLGRVVIYTQNLTEIHSLRGEQFGSYFGYSLAVTDLDGNEMDDVIIGAPLFSNYNTDNTYETGRVYLYYQSSSREFTTKGKDILDGHDSKSRFGLTVAAIGDIDYDGYNDLAVGAPYGGQNGRGAVYIYHGSMKGIITDVQQAIMADDVKSGIETFGWSLAGGLDMDGNQYPDILVGAHDSNRAVFLRSRAVVRVTPTIRIEPQNITLGSEHENCIIGTGMIRQIKVTCITVYTCLSYTGIGVPDKLNFEVTLKLDSLKNDSSRVFYLHADTVREETKVLEARKDKREDCSTHFAYLVKNVRDKLTPIMVEYSFNIKERPQRSKRELTPILNMRNPTMVTEEAHIMKNCGTDNVCIPDLAVTAVHTQDSYTLGEDKKIEILVFVENRREDAFESLLNISFPSGVSFYKITNAKYEIPIFCDSSSKNSSFVLCDLGNPLPSKSKTNFTLVATPKHITGAVSELYFKFEVNSSNAENFTSSINNVAEVKVQIQQAAFIKVGGKSVPEQFVYSESDVKVFRETEEVGPLVEHEYILSNQGPSGIMTSVVNIYWPSQDKNQLNLLHILKAPIVSRADISCLMVNETITTYSETKDNVVTIDGSLKKNKPMKRETNDHDSVEKRDQSKRDIEKRESKELKRIGCVTGESGCTHFQCTIGFIKPDESVSIKIQSNIWTNTLIHKKITEPFNFVSKATAEVLSMPYPNMTIAAGTLSKVTFEVESYVNPERLHPKRKGVDAWIIGVAVSAGLLLLLLLIILLWWCGFFRRHRPEEQVFLVPASQNGDYKQCSDAQYQQK